MNQGFISGLALAAAMLAIPNNTQAIQMKNYHIESRCHTAYVIVDNVTSSAGTYCTNFYVLDNNSSDYWPTDYDLDYKYWERSWAGGGAFRYRVIEKIPNSPINDEPANCTSDEITRWLHATKDVNVENLDRVAKGQGWLKVGSLVRVTYDDGGTEVWIVNAQMTQTAIGMKPAGGTRDCSSY